MSDQRALAVQAVAMKVLEDRVKAYRIAIGADLADTLDPGDRKTAHLADGTSVGAVSYAKGRTTAHVTDERALSDWVAENYPTEVTVTVRPAFLRVLLDSSAKAGEPMGPHGEAEVPGITLGMSNPYLSVRPNPEAVPLLLDAIRANAQLAIDGVFTPSGMDEFAPTDIEAGR